jgi:hypothetical protein
MGLLGSGIWRGVSVYALPDIEYAVGSYLGRVHGFRFVTASKQTHLSECLTDSYY